MAFYYLLRPGEYSNASGDTQHPFRLKDFSILVGALHIRHVHLSTLDKLHSANLTSMTFKTQNNGVKGEKLSNAYNGQPFECPSQATT